MRFEAAIYNKDVRELLASNRHHEILRDDWAELQYFEVDARDEQQARQIMLRKYPESRGFVIESVFKM